MALANYSELQAAVGNYLHRGDLTARFDDFLVLAEERINRIVRCREMETTLTPTAIASNTIAVPTGTVGVKALWLSGYETSPLKAMPFNRLRQQGTEGVAANYAWVGSSLYFDGSGTVTGILYAKVPALTSSASTNWLLTAHPSAYLWGVVTEALAYVMDDTRAMAADARFLAAAREINGSDQRDRFSGPLTVRA